MAEVQKLKYESDMDTGDEGDQVDLKEEGRRLLDMADTPTKAGAASGTGSTPHVTSNGGSPASGPGSGSGSGPGGSTDENQTTRRRNSCCTTDDIRNLKKLQIKKIPQLSVFNAVSFEYLPVTSDSDGRVRAVTGTGIGISSPGLEKYQAYPPQ
jgi:hypothetical protein